MTPASCSSWRGTLPWSQRRSRWSQCWSQSWAPSGDPPAHMHMSCTGQNRELLLSRDWPNIRVKRPHSPDPSYCLWQVPYMINNTTADFTSATAVEESQSDWHPDVNRARAERLWICLGDAGFRFPSYSRWPCLDLVPLWCPSLSWQ